MHFFPREHYSDALQLAAGLPTIRPHLEEGLSKQLFNSMVSDLSVQQGPWTSPQLPYKNMCTKKAEEVQPASRQDAKICEILYRKERQ